MKKNMDQLFFSLFQIGVSINQLNKQSEKQLKLSMVQWSLLKTLVEIPGATAHSLAEAVGVHPSTLTQTLKRLERKKYIFVMSDPSDSRKKLISITRLGKETMDATSKSLLNFSEEFTVIQKELKQALQQIPAEA
ncbi:MAG: MarR family transcriptional regulator [Pseudobdellovibrio sp.]|nr:MarR family transcriptional regulator [Pseudobdellovibrio sp.]